MTRKTVIKSAVSGRFASKEDLKRSPREVYRQSVKKRK